MSTTPFEQIVFAARPDLEKTLASLGYIVQEGDESAVAERLSNAQADAKGELLTDLLQVAPDIYANTLSTGATIAGDMPAEWADWFFSMGYNWDTIDSLTDAIFNPQVLKDCFIACWKWKLYEVQVQDMLSSPNIEAYERQRDLWESRYHERYEKAWRLLRFDLNGDGVIQPAERTRTRNVIRIR